MAHCFVEATAGETEGNNDGLQQQQLSLWLTQHGLNNDHVLSALHQNGVNSLNDFKLLKTEQHINDFVGSLGIKAFMVKMKLTNAIKAFQDEIKSKNDHCDNDEKEASKDFKRKAIRWEALGNKLEKKDTIKIQSNKSEEIKIRKTKQKHKQRLSEWRQEYGEIENGYFGGLGQHIKDTYEHDGVITAGLASVLYTALTIIPILPLAYATIKSNQHKEDQNLTHKKHCNAQSKTFNDKLTQIKQSEQWILSKQKELKQQEQRLNSHSFELERICGIHNKSRVVMVIGPTGFGKSLIANRLLGNEHDIDDIMESKECDFVVADSGDPESVTNELKKKSKLVHIKMEESTKEESFVLSVVDSPGAFDSNEKDNDYNNLMTHYFGACGGINVFAIFFKFDGKLTDKYKELLKQYSEFFGDGLWKHCSIFITRCDMDSKQRKKAVTKGLQTTKDQIHSDLKEISNGQCDDVPIYTFGMENFKQSIFDFLASLMDDQNAFYNKYKCKNNQSPIDVLYRELEGEVKQHKKLVDELHDISEKAKEAKDKVNFDKWTTLANKLQADEELRNEALNALQNVAETSEFATERKWYTTHSNTLQKDINEYKKWLNKYNQSFKLPQNMYNCKFI
eukprot:770011_1